MLDIKLIRENPELVKENIKKKYQFEKLPLVDEVLDIDKKMRSLRVEAENLRAARNEISKQIGIFMKEGKKEEAENAKRRVAEGNARIAEIEPELEKLEEELYKRMLIIPNIIDASVPLGESDEFNVENERFGEPVVPAYEIPYHADIIARFNGLDKDAAGRTSGNGFYFL